jgi:hypothetical protein
MDSTANNVWLFGDSIFIIISVLIAAIIIKLKHRNVKYRERRYFPEYVKKETLLDQNYRCAICKRSAGVWNFDHVDGNRSNNDANNCQALCLIVVLMLNRLRRLCSVICLQRVTWSHGWSQSHVESILHPRDIGICLIFYIVLYSRYYKSRLIKRELFILSILLSIKHNLSLWYTYIF